MHEGKTRLSELVERARRGERVIIARSGLPVAEIVPHRPDDGPRRGGQWQSQARIADDFDAPLPALEELFET